MNLTYKEMKNQYQALRKTYDYITVRKDELIEFFTKTKPESLTYIGCGSSYSLCQSGELTAKVRLGIPATALPAGDLMLNLNTYKKIFKGTMVVTLSRSGSTSEVVKSIEKLRASAKVSVLTISCVTDSVLARVSDFVLEMPWAFDNSVCQTSSVTNLYTANLLAMAYISGDTKLVSDIDDAIKLGNDYMEKYEDMITKASGGNWSKVIVLADGEMQGLASEASLVFTEVSKVQSNYHHLLDVRHGPMVLIDKDTLVVAAINSNGFDYQKALILEIINKGAKVITYSDKTTKAIDGVALNVSSETVFDTAVSGIPFVFIAQMAAYTKAVEKGLNPDNPEGLDAWIKL